jgi:tetratricopeptide (TPR) repeat protein
MIRGRQRLTIALGLCTCWLQSAQGYAQQTVPSADAIDEKIDTGVGSLVDKAEAYAAAAFEAYARKEYVQAVVLYERAHALAPNAALIIYNIARIYDLALQSRGLAIDYYQRFVAAPGAAPDHIRVARRRIAELEAAERAAVNQAIQASAQQSASDTEEIDAAAASPAPTAFASLPPAGDPMPIAPTLNGPIMTPRPEGPWTTRELAAVAVGGVGLASVGVGVGFVLSARSKSDTWKRDCKGNDCSTQRAVDAAEAAARQADIGTAGLLAGGTLMVLGGVLWFVDFSSTKPGDASSSWSLLPQVSKSEISGAISGRF